MGGKDWSLAENLLVFSKSDPANIILEVEFSNTLHEGVVPQHDLIWGEFGVVSSTD